MCGRRRGRVAYPAAYPAADINAGQLQLRGLPRTRRASSSSNQLPCDMLYLALMDESCHSVPVWQRMLMRALRWSSRLPVSPSPDGVPASRPQVPLYKSDPGDTSSCGLGLSENKDTALGPAFALFVINFLFSAIAAVGLTVFRDSELATFSSMTNKEQPTFDNATVVNEASYVDDNEI